MSTPTRTEPPYVPLRRSGWPIRRTPLWAVAAALVLVAGIALVSLSHRPSHAEQAADLNGFMHDVNAGIESCAGGVRESMNALNTVESGDRARYGAAVGMLRYNAQNCSPANNQPLADFVEYQVPESLARFHLADCVNDIVTWAFPYAMQSQEDMLAVLTARGPAARATANATLQAELRKLDRQRATIYSIMRTAERAVSDNAPLPVLPG
ncbi:MAG: hypothetical protein JOY82_19810 [Streptosporangiaceae bacterium]|nr:hypothetical protein [Streptosporangiaceae bacterium]MBV9856731.1 hypothetical protein [Streptosporangiaceae bacterium]